MNHFLLAVAVRLVCRVSHGSAAWCGDNLQEKDLQVISNPQTRQPSCHHCLPSLVCRYLCLLRTVGTVGTVYQCVSNHASPGHIARPARLCSCSCWGLPWRELCLYSVVFTPTQSEAETSAASPEDPHGSCTGLDLRRESTKRNAHPWSPVSEEVMPEQHQQHGGLHGCPARSD